MKASIYAFIAACLFCGVVLFWPVIMFLLGALVSIGVIGGVGFIIYHAVRQYLTEQAKTK